MSPLTPRVASYASSVLIVSRVAGPLSVHIEIDGFASPLYGTSQNAAEGWVESRVGKCFEIVFHDDRPRARTNLDVAMWIDGVL